MSFGQLSRIQRARLSSLTSPAASDMIMAVACAWSGANRTPFLRKKHHHGHEGDALVAVDERMVLGEPERIGGGKLGQRGSLVLPFVDRASKADRATPHRATRRAAETAQLAAVNRDDLP